MFQMSMVLGFSRIRKLCRLRIAHKDGLRDTQLIILRYADQNYVKKNHIVKCINSRICFTYLGL